MCKAISGIDHFGFGTFLCNIKPAEIQIDEFSKQALLAASEKRGLNGLEIWSDNRIAWGDPRHEIIIPLEEISRARGSEKWIKKIVTSKEQG